VSFFRARRVVKDPAGQVWELYVTRSAMPADPKARGLYSANIRIMDEPMGSGCLLAIPVGIVQFLGSMILLPLLRAPFAYARGRRSGAVRIEAVSFYPERETRFWTTTPERLEGVLEEIAAGLARGVVAQPSGAVYAGSREG
jgi:hypothetical protein